MTPEAWYQATLAVGQRPFLADYGDGRPPTIQFLGREYDPSRDSLRWRWAKGENKAKVTAYLRSIDAVHEWETGRIGAGCVDEKEIIEALWRFAERAVWTEFTPRPDAGPCVAHIRMRLETPTTDTFFVVHADAKTIATLNSAGVWRETTDA